MRAGWKCATVALALVGTSAADTARADEYPSRPIRIVVPYAPGGGADTVARIVAKRVGETIGQTIVIENRGGAGSIIGTEMVAKAEPDGYTLLLGQSGPISINPAVYKDLRYDPERDFAPVTMTTAYPYILVVNAKLPVRSLQDFVALARAKPGAMNYGTTGIGAANHLVTELFNGKAGLKMAHIPYRGTALAVADLVGEQVTVVFGDPVSVLPHMQAGTLRALAVTSPQRQAALPDVPAMAEFLPGYEAYGWYGIVAPKGTPAEIVEKLNKEINAALADGKTRERLTDLGCAVFAGSPADFGRFIADDTEKWGKVVKLAGIRPE
jgi:tripartite-type tricarboxylate transporter receptor subunit TctC